MLRYTLQGLDTPYVLPRTTAPGIRAARWSDCMAVGFGVGLGRSSPVGSPVPYGLGSEPPVVTGLATAGCGASDVPAMRTASKLRMKPN